ncbi:MAG TPA: GNAT family N-acetyltransferase [Ruminococcus sp.]|nr:GNAT family N-acetyltransferase [Ruminococcus sp.]
MKDIVIRKVDKDTELSVQLIDFVRNFSWDEVREHTLHVLENWELSDWETPFAAISEGRIIGMVTVMKTDYYPLPEIYPWISTLFVSEEYRGKRISQKLIEAAEEYARASGFEKTYIPTEFVGLYEKNGYSYVRDIENYGGGVDRLYAKEI